MLIINESSIGAFLLTALYLIYLVITLYISFISCTCWVPTISVLNLAIFPCYSNLLLRRRWWTRILRRGVLGYALPRLPFLWCYGVFRCSISLTVVLVVKDIIYVIIILYIMTFWYLWALLAVCVEQLILGHAYDEYSVGFGIKTGYDSRLGLIWAVHS
jgi:hypothetical protein